MNIKNQLTIFTLSLVFCHFAWSAERSEITVVVDGLGKTANEAAQNAAENALKQVVGSFVDTETVLLKQTEISGSIRSESKKITTNTKEYSQGSIKSFEILKTAADDGLIRVTAKVSVRVEDFKAYIRKTAFAEVEVDESLFAQIATDEKQKDNSESIILDSILMPLLSGEVTTFKIGKPVAADTARNSKDELLSFAMKVFDGKHNRSRDPSVDNEGLQLLSYLKNEINFVVPVEITVNSDFIKNATARLEAITKKKRNGEILKFGRLSCPDSYDYSGEYGVPIPTIAIKRSSQSNVVECFSIDQLAKMCRRDSQDIRDFRRGLFQALCSDTDGWMNRTRALPKLRLTLSDKNGDAIFEYLIPQTRRRLDQWSLTGEKDVLLLGSSLPIAAESRNSAGANTPLIFPTYSQKIFLAFSLPASNLKDVRSIEFGYETSD